MDEITFTDSTETSRTYYISEFYTDKTKMGLKYLKPATK